MFLFCSKNCLISGTIAKKKRPPEVPPLLVFLALLLEVGDDVRRVEFERYGDLEGDIYGYGS